MHPGLTKNILKNHGFFVKNKKKQKSLVFWFFIFRKAKAAKPRLFVLQYFIFTLLQNWFLSILTALHKLSMRYVTYLCGVTVSASPVFT
jgi:hypothetical protein